jgi:hypothetical protein
MYHGFRGGSRGSADAPGEAFEELDVRYGVPQFIVQVGGHEVAGFPCW